MKKLLLLLFIVACAHSRLRTANTPFVCNTEESVLNMDNRSYTVQEFNEALDVVQYMRLALTDSIHWNDIEQLERYYGQDNVLCICFIVEQTQNMDTMPVEDRAVMSNLRTYLVERGVLK